MAAAADAVTACGPELETMMMMMICDMQMQGSMMPGLEKILIKMANKHPSFIYTIYVDTPRLAVVGRSTCT